jgi:hypothetical protein
LLAATACEQSPVAVEEPAATPAPSLSVQSAPGQLKMQAALNEVAAQGLGNGAIFMPPNIVGFTLFNFQTFQICGFFAEIGDKGFVRVNPDGTWSLHLQEARAIGLLIDLIGGGTWDNELQARQDRRGHITINFSGVPTPLFPGGPVFIVPEGTAQVWRGNASLDDQGNEIGPEVRLHCGLTDDANGNRRNFTMELGS